MKNMNRLSTEELDRLKNGIISAYGIPFIDDIEDFIWEAIFSYVRNIPLVDPLLETREKKLFDLVDKSRKIGWSAKALQTNAKHCENFEIVIQRSDIFKKSAELGFKSLSIESDPAILGQALIKHWLEQKVEKDMAAQGVCDARVCILLKSKDRKKYTFIEQPIEKIQASKITWCWTNDNKSGLQGWFENQLKYRWYHGQKQFFEVFRVPEDAPTVELKPKRIPIKELVEILIEELNKKETLTS